MQDVKPSYKLEVFEGPLDLLLSLIAKNEIDIYDIPIALIFEQYMDYIHMMQTLDMDVASDFIVMASELMLIKSRMLLPKAVVDGVEVDPREDLVRTLMEYQLAKEEAAYLADRYGRFSGRFVKETDELGVDKTFVGDQESSFLLDALQRLLARLRLDESMKNDEAAKTLSHILNARPSSVSERTGVILRMLEKKPSMRFLDIMLECRSRSEIIASFMAILSLISAQKVVALYAEDDTGNPKISLRGEDGASGRDALREDAGEEDGIEER